MQQMRTKFIYILKQWYIILGNKLIRPTTITYYSLQLAWLSRRAGNSSYLDYLISAKPQMLNLYLMCR